MTPKLIPLITWVKETYGDAVSMHRARRWCRQGLIQPPAKKHGRDYFVTPDASYTERAVKSTRLVDRLRAAETSRPVTH